MPERYPVSVSQVQRIPTAVIRRHVRREDLPLVVPDGCGRVWVALRAEGKRGGRNVALYREKGTIVEAGVELTTPFTPTGEILLSELPAGAAASTIHYGPYTQLGAAHDAVQQWCRANGKTFGRCCWEIYDHWRDEWNTDPSRITTGVFYELGDSTTR